MPPGGPRRRKRSGMRTPDPSEDLLADLRAALSRLDPVPDSVRRAAERVLHHPDAALRYPPDRVVGMGYFPDELGLSVAAEPRIGEA